MLILKRNTTSKKHQQGFTLLEVMVALLIVAVALGGAVKVIGNAAANSSRMNNKTFANWVALNQIAELRIGKEWPKFGEKKGDSEMAGRKWAWQQISIKTDDDNIRRIEVSVWSEDDKKSSPFVTVVGFLPKP
ncbi:MAG: general secretion pathway protein I [Cocleimonas sp.]|jgi:general secretion pathway protein I